MPDFADAEAGRKFWPQISQMLLNRSWVGISRPAEPLHNLRKFAKFAAKISCFSRNDHPQGSSMTAPQPWRGVRRARFSKQAIFAADERG
jgi:hypothetical protein